MDNAVAISVVESSAPRRLSIPAPLGHYRFIGVLGRGGMAEVHEVEDVRKGRRIALKRLLPQSEPEKWDKALSLFEREYHSLSELAHPRIVEVYDYALDEAGPFYTMELLSGGDLAALVPLDYRRACRVARDVCSALSLLHSRSMVHRDLSPRNVRCTADGLAKLIDFGAMAPIGRNRAGIVGTPAYCAPEVINGQPLDARTDLYALGATLYYTLTGRHAYPAKDFASLPERWLCACPNPSEYVPEIPEALDALVMELLRLDPLARPPSAFEVIARLNAIDGTEFDENLLVARAYLSTPNLVGRDAALTTVQRKIHRAQKGRGRALIVSGAPGSGRSRFMNAVALEAKLRGVTVASVDADDARDGDYGVVRAVARRLIAEMPQRAAEIAGDDLLLLGSVVPELRSSAGDVAPAAFDKPSFARPLLQQALRKWLVALARFSPLVVVVDDVHAADEPSAALLSLLAHDVQEERLLIVASCDPGATPTAPAAMKLLTDSADRIKLMPLAPEESEQLLRSIFGNVPNVGLLAHRIHGVAGGNPRNVMRLAQHLIDQGVVRYQGGAWSVPDAFDARDLPTTMAQALEAHVAVLSPEAREVACALSLAPGQTVTADELRFLVGAESDARPETVVDELLHAQVLRASGEYFGLAQEGWAAALQAGISAETRCVLHLRLARLFERRGSDEFRVGKHLLRGGEIQRGLDILTAHAERSQEETGQNPEVFFRYLQSLPPDWLQIFEDALTLCAETGRPRKDTYVLRGRLGGLFGLTGTPDTKHSPALIAELVAASGLGAFYAEDASLDAGVRLRTALVGAAQRYATSSPHDRVFEPGPALRHLGRAVVQACGVITTGLDLPYLQSLPSLLPLAHVSPAFGVVQMLLDGMNSRCAGRFEEALVTYTRLVERLKAPDSGGLDGSHAEYMRLGVLNGIGMIEAGMGKDSSLERAAELETAVKSRVNAVQVRMLHHLWQGNVGEATLLRQQVELLQIQDSPRQLFEGSHLLWQITAHGLSEDLTHLKQSIDEIAVLAARYPGWVPVRHYAAGEYHRAGGAHESALVEFQSALSLVGAGDHQIWPYLAGAHLKSLYDLGRHDQALKAGEAYLAAAEKAGVGYATNYILLPLSVVRAKLRLKDAAIAGVERVLEQFVALGMTGLNLGIAYETRARVSLMLGDKPRYTQYLGLCREIYTTRSNAALVTKFEKLRRSASVNKGVMESHSKTGFFSTASTMAASRLDFCQEPESRASCALSMLMDQCGASAGVLYLVGAHGPFAAATHGKADEVLGSLALEYLMNEASEAETTGEGSSLTTGDSKVNLEGPSGEKYRSVLLTHESAEGYLITGVAVIAVPGEAPFADPSRVANEVSRHLQRVGDATGMVVAG